MPDRLTILAPAKVNLCIDVFRKNETGYHEIQTVLHEHSTLYDTLTFFESDQHHSLSIEFEGEFFEQPQEKTIPKNHENSILKAVDLIRNEFQISRGIGMKLIKRIPVSAGLGGGSSNAAATLKALNILWNLGLTEEKLISLASKLGMDVPFFIKGKTALCTHFGEIVTELPHLSAVKIEILPRNTWPALSNDNEKKTAGAYASLRLNECAKNTDKTTLLVEAIKSGAVDKIPHLLHNDFELLYRSELPPSSHLAGSGPACFLLN